MGFPALQFELAAMCFRRRTEILPIDQFPGTFAARRSSLSALVLRQTHLYIRSRTDVETTIRLALQNVDAWHVRDLVDLLGIEPATFPAGRDARASICSMQCWWTWSGSNRRPSGLAGTRSFNSALLNRPKSGLNLVDLVGIEPTTFPARRDALF